MREEVLQGDYGLDDTVEDLDKLPTIESEEGVEGGEPVKSPTTKVLNWVFRILVGQGE